MELSESSITIILSVITSLIPAVWILSSKIQKLQGSLDTHSAKLVQQMDNIEKRVDVMSTQLHNIESRHDDLKERVVVVETKLKTGRN